jgi:hypothetical protein
MNALVGRRRRLALLAAAVTLTGLLTASGAGAATSGTGWRVFASISVPHKSVLLGNIDVVSPADAWVAGIINDGDRGQAALLEHWNGSVWLQVSLPAGVGSRLAGNVPLAVVGASSRRDVWLFGQFGRYLRLIGGHWTLGSIPSFPKQTFIDQAVVFSPCDVWAFGLRAIGSVSRDNLAFLPFAARFDGRGWRQVTVPGHASDGEFTVSEVSARDIWAVEGTVTPDSGRYLKPRILHWDGRSWRPIATQPRRPKGATLTTILAVGPDNVWVGGSTPDRKGGSTELLLHWNGRSWTSADPPATATEDTYYAGGITPDGRGGFWLLGTSFAAGLSGPERVWHYSRGTWSAPTVLSSRLLVLSIASVPHRTSVWGIAAGPGLVKSVILLYGAPPR